MGACARAKLIFKYNFKSKPQDRTLKYRVRHSANISIQIHCIKQPQSIV